jgi:hypothetical protein
VTLDNAQLRALIVDKSPWLQNNVTNTKFRITYSGSGMASSAQTMTPIDPAYLTSRFAENQGQSLQNYVGRSTVQPGLAGNPAENSYLGTTSPY